MKTIWVDVAVMSISEQAATVAEVEAGEKTIAQILEEFDNSLVEAIKLILDGRDQVHQAISLVDKAMSEKAETG